MWWPLQWLVIYVLGGITFVPLVIISVVGYVLTYESVPVGDDDRNKAPSTEPQSSEEKKAQNPRVEGTGTSSSRALSGWLTVRRQFKPTSSGVTSLFASSRPTDLSGAEINVEEKEEELKSVHNGTPTTYSARIAQTYRQMVEARQAKKDVPLKEYFFCVLKGSVLFLYDDEAQSDCIAAIGVDRYEVGIETSTGEAFNGKDAEMFSKRTGLVMRIADKAKKGEKSGMPTLVMGMEQGEEGRDLEDAPWFLFTKSNTKMEDWYIALVQASSLSPDTSSVYSIADMRALVDTIDTEPDPIPMRWLNALLGRIFFGLYRTEALEQFIIGKIMRKLSKVPRPSFLGPIVVREVNVGTFPPILSKPMLKDLTAEGTAAFEVNFAYRSQPAQPNSEVRITIATTATIPTGFKPYVVDLVLAVLVKKIEGNLMIQIKNPPSNRVWYGFTQMPKLEVEIRPIVSERKIQMSMVLNAIEKQLRDVIAESIVLPYMDDIAFFNTTGLPIRGGIFSEAGKDVEDQVPPEAKNQRVNPAVIAADVTTAAEDPASAVPETSTTRQRHSASAQSFDMTPPEVSVEKPAESVLARIDTAPAVIDTGTSVKQEPAGSNNKKWFAKSGRTPSLTSQTVLNASLNTSQESLTKQRSHSAEREKSSAAVGALEAGSLTESSTRPPSPPRKGSIPFHSLGGVPASTSSTAAIDQAAPHSESALASSSTAALLTSLRARDKKAIQSQVSTARDAVKKWGVTWAAKRRPHLPNKLDERDEEVPSLSHGVPDEAVPPRLSGTAEAFDPPHSPTLKERLDAAATQTTTRERSASSASGSSATGGRPFLLQSPSKSTVALVNHSTSPPSFTLASSRPIIEASKASIPAPNPPRSSSANGVYTQPSAGRSMVVPRVVKRPGEVTGMGSHPESGMNRRVSTEDRVDSERDGVKPARPSQQPSDKLRSNSNIDEVITPSISVDPPNRPLIPPTPSGIEESVQPIPKSPISEDPISDVLPSSSSPVREELVRVDSAPATSITSSPPPPTSLLETEAESTSDLTTVDEPRSAEQVPSEPSTTDGQASLVEDKTTMTNSASSAEDALRFLNRRNQEALSAEHPEEGS